MPEIKICIFGTAKTGKTIYQNTLNHCLFQTGNRFIATSPATARYFADHLSLIEKLPFEEITKQIGSTGQKTNLEGKLTYKGESYQLKTFDYLGESAYGHNLLEEDNILSSFDDSDGILCFIDAEDAIDKNGAMSSNFGSHILIFCDQLKKLNGGNKITKPIAIVVSKSDVLLKKDFIQQKNHIGLTDWANKNLSTIQTEFANTCYQHKIFFVSSFDYLAKFKAVGQKCLLSITEDSSFPDIINLGAPFFYIIEEKRQIEIKNLRNILKDKANRLLQDISSARKAIRQQSTIQVQTYIIELNTIEQWYNSIITNEISNVSTSNQANLLEIKIEKEKNNVSKIIKEYQSEYGRQEEFARIKSMIPGTSQRILSIKQEIYNFKYNKVKNIAIYRQELNEKVNSVHTIVEKINTVNSLDVLKGLNRELEQNKTEAIGIQNKVIKEQNKLKIPVFVYYIGALLLAVLLYLLLFKSPEYQQIVKKDGVLLRKTPGVFGNRCDYNVNTIDKLTKVKVLKDSTIVCENCKILANRFPNVRDLKNGGTYLLSKSAAVEVTIEDPKNPNNFIVRHLKKSTNTTNETIGEFSIPKDELNEMVSGWAYIETEDDRKGWTSKENLKDYKK